MRYWNRISPLPPDLKNLDRQQFACYRQGDDIRTLRRHHRPFSERVSSISRPWFGRIQHQFKICFWPPSVGLSISGATKPCLANDALPLQPSLPQPSSYARSYRDDWEESILYITSALCSLKHLLHYGMCLLEL